ncbi:DUF1284 domain-containing protein [Bacillus weihaiensis]|uniref:DUF1284 domain-containing protein n=1 Tax=Bacillus weihaiensis TaxID=1547283 RepID=A0A1L3MT69_9BACI|nr:DUF1284 domain-containing protein [Bacillus weihaiensis]APH05529.1 hypothetical protein A9C19_12635 [Bacillus weihaiensis]
MFKLRGHHLFCLMGYRGMGYSKEYVENMTKIHQTLRAHPNTLVELVLGPDQLCEKYPNSGDYHCQDVNIFERDATILRKVNLETGQRLPWKEIENRIKKYVLPSDIQTVCKTCSWRTYGVCEEGIEDMLSGNGLRKVD